ncbi:RICIN domain-containing protein [Crossiella sp. NPDC003009]
MRRTLSLLACVLLAGVLTAQPAQAEQRFPDQHFPKHGDITPLVNVNSGKCLEIADYGTHNGARAQQWRCEGVHSQHWVWHYLSNSTQGSIEWRHYWLKNRHSGKCLEIADSSTANGARAQQWDCDGRAGGQIWTIAYTSGSTFPLRRGSLENGFVSTRCLEIADSSKANGARAQQWQCANINTMNWDW